METTRALRRIRSKPSTEVPGGSKKFWKLHYSSPTEHPEHTVQHPIDRVLHKKYYVVIPDGTPPVPPYLVPYRISTIPEFHESGPNSLAARQAEEAAAGTPAAPPKEEAEDPAASETQEASARAP